MRQFAIAIIACALIVSCTKKSGAPQEPIPPNAIKSDTNPDRLIVDTVIDVPSKYKKNAQPLDVLIWDVKDNKGSVVAIGTMDVEKFPIKLKVKAKDLVKPLDPKSPIAVTARLVKMGDETKPPHKGQLVGFMGVSSSELKPPVVPEGISKKLLTRAERTLGLSDKFKILAVGSHAKISLEPYQF